MHLCFQDVPDVVNVIFAHMVMMSAIDLRSYATRHTNYGWGKVRIALKCPVMPGVYDIELDAGSIALLGGPPLGLRFALVVPTNVLRIVSFSETYHQPVIYETSYVGKVKIFCIEVDSYSDFTIMLWDRNSRQHGQIGFDGKWKARLNYVHKNALHYVAHKDMVYTHRCSEASPPYQDD